MIPARAKPLVALFVGALEVQVGGRSWALQHGQPVLQDRALGERPVSILLEELVGVEVFSRRFAPADQEQMVDAQAERVRPTQDSVDAQSERHTPVIDGFAKGCAVLFAP